MAAFAIPAAADVTIFQGNIAGNPEENVLFTAGMTGPTIIGETNQTSTIVDINGNETLTSPSNGQARVTTTDGGLNLFDLTLADPHLGFTALEFNLFAPSARNTTVSFTAYDQFGNTFTGSSPYTLGGKFQNFFNFVATNGELITRLQFVTSADLRDVRQIRLGGVTSFGAVPEPAAWAMMIVGLGGVGALMRRRRTLILAA
jgi:hypothetical protein